MKKLLKKRIAREYLFLVAILIGSLFGGIIYKVYNDFKLKALNKEIKSLQVMLDKIGSEKIALDSRKYQLPTEQRLLLDKKIQELTLSENSKREIQHYVDSIKETESVPLDDPLKILDGTSFSFLLPSQKKKMDSLIKAASPIKEQKYILKNRSRRYTLPLKKIPFLMIFKWFFVIFFPLRYFLYGLIWSVKTTREKHHK